MRLELDLDSLTVIVPVRSLIDGSLNLFWPVLLLMKPKTESSGFYLSCGCCIT